MQISVIICTHNRYESLKATLDSLFVQERDGSFNYEILVIDNNSKDQTKRMVESYIEKFSNRIRYIFESNQGVSFARNRGIEESKGSIIAFTDDDCTAESQWIFKIAKAFREDVNLDGVIGECLWESGDYFYDSDNLIRGNGMNMSFRRNIFDEIGLFDIHLGTGSIGESAEDAEFVYRANKMKKNISLLNSIKVIHKRRASYKEKLAILYRDNVGATAFKIKGMLKYNDKSCLKRMAAIIYYNSLGLIDAIKNKNDKRIAFKIVQLTGIFIGFTKGIYIFFILIPFKSICQKQALY